MTFLSRFRRRRVSAHAVDGVVRQLGVLAKSLGISPGEQQAFVKALFATMTGAVPERFVHEAFSFDEAARMETRLRCASYVIGILVDCRE
jgi:hypothetical protein